MDSARDAGILGLIVVLALCLTVFLMGFKHPTMAVVDFLMPGTAAVVEKRRVGSRALRIAAGLAIAAAIRATSSAPQLRPAAALAPALAQPPRG